MSSASTFGTASDARTGARSPLRRYPLVPNPGRVEALDAGLGDPRGEPASEACWPSGPQYTVSQRRRLVPNWCQTRSKSQGVDGTAVGPEFELLRTWVIGVVLRVPRMRPLNQRAGS